MLQNPLYNQRQTVGFWAQLKRLTFISIVLSLHADSDIPIDDEMFGEETLISVVRYV